MTQRFAVQLDLATLIENDLEVLKKKLKEAKKQNKPRTVKMLEKKIQHLVSRLDDL